MPRQSWDASAGPLRRSVPRRAPPAALGPSGHGSVGAVRSQQTLWVAHVPETRLGPACRTGMASFPPPESEPRTITVKGALRASRVMPSGHS